VRSTADLKPRLAALLLERSYHQGEVTLTSGRKSDYYFDCKQTALHPEGSYLLGRLILDRVRPDIRGIGGPTLGADPLVSAVCLLSHLDQRPLPAFIVRKNAKGHGTQRYLEGMANLTSGQRVAVVEDVVTTGGSLLKACAHTTEAGLAVAQVLCVLDREEGGRERLLDAGYDLDAIFTRDELFRLAPGAAP